MLQDIKEEVNSFYPSLAHKLTKYYSLIFARDPTLEGLAVVVSVTSTNCPPDSISEGDPLHTAQPAEKRETCQRGLAVSVTPQHTLGPDEG